MPTQPRQLPIPVPLVRAETYRSYLSRIAQANHLNPADLGSYLSRDRRHIDRPDQDRLAAVTGHSPSQLTSMITGLQPSPNRGRSSPIGTLACRRCMGQRGIFVGVHRVTPDLLLCRRHRRWLGDGVSRPAEQYDLTPVPDVIQTQRRHHQLLHRHGGHAFRTAFDQAGHVLHQWTGRGDWPTHRHRRLSHYLDLHRWSIPRYDPIMKMVNYPETVALAGLLASDQWAALAASTHPDHRRRFDHEVARRLRIPYAWYTAHDLLGRWRQDDARRRRKLLNFNETSTTETSHSS